MNNLVTKSKHAVLKSFLGVNLEVLSHGPKTMVAKMLYKLGDRVPSHSHPNEQSGYVLSGSYRISIGAETHDLTAGDSYTVPAGVLHEIIILEPGQVVDVFSPPRADYL